MTKDFLINIDSGSIGDTILAMPYIEKYRKDNNIEKILVLGNEAYNFLFKKTLPNIKIISNKGNIEEKIFIHHGNQKKPLQTYVANQLGYENPEYIRPVIDKPENEKRYIKNKYITLNVHSTAQLKYWNAPGDKLKTQYEATNWNILSKKLRKKGITPVVLEPHELFGKPGSFNGLPDKAVKKIGLNLQTAIEYIYQAEFHIGLSSGQSWIAHALGKPLVMISNFTEDWSEIDLNAKDYIRIVNKNVCHGCCHKYKFDDLDWYWCPLHKGTDREFECHKSITPDMVMDKIRPWLEGIKKARN